MRLVIISDTHGLHPWIDMPEGDVLIHCGDWCKDFGNVDEMKRFADWMEAQSYDSKVVIAGNHDFPAQDNDARCKGNFKKRGIHYLKDSGVTIDGRVFWGSPWQPEFGGLAFNLPRGERLWDKWRRIPPKTDVLVTHGPPFEILDNAVHPDNLFAEDKPVGCRQLLRRVRQVRPKVHCFGHVHVDYGVKEIEGTTFVNAAICKGHLSMGSKPTKEAADKFGGLRKPVVVDVPERTDS